MLGTNRSSVQETILNSKSLVAQISWTLKWKTLIMMNGEKSKAFHFKCQSQCFEIEYCFILIVRRDLFYLYSWKYKNAMSHSWNKLHIQRQNNEYPLNIINVKKSSKLILHQTYTHSRKRDKGWYESMDGWMGARTDGRSDRCQKHLLKDKVNTFKNFL